MRGFIADYGVPFMVLVWTAISYTTVNDVPKGIPRRLFSPNPWSPGAYSNWTVIKVIPILHLLSYIKHYPLTNSNITEELFPLFLFASKTLLETCVIWKTDCSGRGNEEGNLAWHMP